MFFWNSCFFHDPVDVGNLISCSSAFSKTSLNNREFTVHVLLKPGLENFEHYFPSMWDDHFMGNRWGNSRNSVRLYFLGSKITVDSDCSNEIKTFAPWKKSCDQPRQLIKKQRHYFANKGLSSQSYYFSSSHVWMWELDYKESWVLKNWCFWPVVLEKTLESPSDCKEIQPVHPKGNQSWIFIGRTDVEAETPILWTPDVKNWIIWKDPDAGKDWRQEEKGMTEDEMVGWHHRLNGHEFGWAPGVGDGPGGLACCSPWGHRVRHDWANDLTYWLMYPYFYT